MRGTIQPIFDLTLGKPRGLGPFGGSGLTIVHSQSQALKPGLSSCPSPYCVFIPRSCPGTGREAEGPATPLCMPASERKRSRLPDVLSGKHRLTVPHGHVHWGVLSTNAGSYSSGSRRATHRNDFLSSIHQSVGKPAGSQLTIVSPLSTAFCSFPSAPSTLRSSEAAAASH